MGVKIYHQPYSVTFLGSRDVIDHVKIGLTCLLCTWYGSFYHRDLGLKKHTHTLFIAKTPTEDLAKAISYARHRNITTAYFKEHYIVLVVHTRLLNV